MKPRKHLDPEEFIAFLKDKLVEYEDAVALGDTAAAARPSGEFLGGQGRPRRSPVQAARPWSIPAKPRWNARPAT